MIDRLLIAWVPRVVGGLSLVRRSPALVGFIGLRDHEDFDIHPTCTTEDGGRSEFRDGCDRWTILCLSS